MAHPLEKTDLDNINNALKAIKDTRTVLERAKIAKIDVSAQEDEINNAEAQLKAIKQGFFPSGKP